MPLQVGAAALASLGEADRAREWLARALAIDPNDNQARNDSDLDPIGDHPRYPKLLELVEEDH